MMLCGCPKTWRCPFVRESPANVTILAAKLDDMLKVPNAVLRFRPSAAVLKKPACRQCKATNSRFMCLLEERSMQCRSSLGSPTWPARQREKSKGSTTFL
jgi:hypothetical protein